LAAVLLAVNNLTVQVGALTGHVGVLTGQVGVLTVQMGALTGQMAVNTADIQRIADAVAISQNFRTVVSTSTVERTIFPHLGGRYCVYTALTLRPCVLSFACTVIEGWSHHAAPALGERTAARRYALSEQSAGESLVSAPRPF
jgi:hypothetical protein